MSWVTNFRGALRLHHDSVQPAKSGVAGAVADREFLIGNMVCEGCAERIADTLSAIPGVRNVKSKVSEKRIRVTFDSAAVGAQQLTDAMAAIGFEAVVVGEGR